MENINLKDIKLRGDNLLVEPLIIKDEVTESGIIVPANKFDQWKNGVALKVGPGRKTKNGKRIKMTVEKGDDVVFHFNDCQPSTGKMFLVDNKNCYIMSEDKILYCKSRSKNK